MPVLLIGTRTIQVDDSRVIGQNGLNNLEPSNFTLNQLKFPDTLQRLPHTEYIT